MPGVTELVAGLLIVVGLFTRTAAFVGSGAMAVAYFWQHQPDALLPHANHGIDAVMLCFAFLLRVFTGVPPPKRRCDHLNNREALGALLLLAGWAPLCCAGGAGACDAYGKGDEKLRAGNDGAETDSRGDHAAVAAGPDDYLARVVAEGQS